MISGPRGDFHFVQCVHRLQARPCFPVCELLQTFRPLAALPHSGKNGWGRWCNGTWRAYSSRRCKFKPCPVHRLMLI